MRPREGQPAGKRATRVVVLGTGTGVGKTWVTQTLTEALQRAGARATALKPIETGVPSQSTPAITDPRSTIRSVVASPLAERSDAAVLASISSTRPPAPPYALPDPVSPHLAARRAGRHIELRKVNDYVMQVENEVTSHVTSFVLIESAGGCLSPLGLGLSNADLALALEPAIWVLVAPDALGVLHDVSATLGVLAARRRLPDHVVLSAAREPDASTGTNAAELEALGIVTATATVGRGDTTRSMRSRATSWLGPSACARPSRSRKGVERRGSRSPPQPKKRASFGRSGATRSRRGHDSPPFEPETACADALGLVGGMGDDDDECSAVAFGDELAFEKGGARGIEARPGFVEKQHARRVHERTRERDALPLPARKRGDAAIDKCAGLDARPRTFARLSVVHAVETRSELDVLAPGELAIEERLVSDPAELGTHGLNVVAERVVRDAPERRSDHGREHGEECALAGAVRTFERNELTRTELGRNTAQRRNRTKRPRHAFNDNPLDPRPRDHSTRWSSGGAGAPTATRTLRNESRFPVDFGRAGPC